MQSLPSRIKKTKGLIQYKTAAIYAKTADIYSFFKNIHLVIPISCIFVGLYALIFLNLAK